MVDDFVTVLELMSTILHLFCYITHSVPSSSTVTHEYPLVSSGT